MADAMDRLPPILIQGGMGVAVSDWKLARAVSQTGQLGVVSGTAIDTVLVRRLQLGDAGGHMRRALAEFPYPDVAERVLDRYFVEGGLPPNAPLIPTRVLGIDPPRDAIELVVVANFVEVYLAKADHDGLVGINFLEKIQTPTLPSLFGALLADVDYVLMGAGIPRLIPGILDALVQGEAVELPLQIHGADQDHPIASRFDPLEFGHGDIPWLERPKFLAIVASSALANVLARKSNGRVDGFVVEGPTAGGHNAPPRSKRPLDEHGEPIYDERDVVDLDAMAAVGLPFWLAGSYGAPEKVCEAVAAGATGVQVGTAFAFCEESGLRSDIKARVLQQCRDGTAVVFTDPLASPTGFPFKVLRYEGSLSEPDVYAQRSRVCDLGFLRQGYLKADGTVGWRCPGEPVKAYVRKGGRLEETMGRKCICNGLLATVGLPQQRANGNPELPLVTCGNEVAGILQFLKDADATTYSARDVVARLLSQLAGSAVPEVPQEIAT